MIVIFDMPHVAGYDHVGNDWQYNLPAKIMQLAHIAISVTKETGEWGVPKNRYDDNELRYSYRWTDEKTDRDQDLKHYIKSMMKLQLYL